MSEGYRLDQGDGCVVVGLLDEMAEVYEEVYTEPPYESGALWQRHAFLDRTRRQATRDGFEIVSARSEGGELIGYSFGVPFAQGRWWSGDASTPPHELLAASKFAPIELIVRAPWRGRGIGHVMHDRLLANRPEQYAILTAVPNCARPTPVSTLGLETGRHRPTHTRLANSRRTGSALSPPKPLRRGKYAWGCPALTTGHRLLRVAIPGNTRSPRRPPAMPYRSPAEQAPPGSSARSNT